MSASQTEICSAPVWSDLAAECRTSPEGESVLLATRITDAEWLKPAMQQLSALLRLEENWDSYGGLPVDPVSVEHARFLLRRLAQIQGIEPPTVTATPDGNAAVCWDDGKRSLDVEVFPDGTMEYVLLTRTMEPVEDEGRTKNRSSVAEMLTRLY